MRTFAILVGSLLAGSGHGWPATYTVWRTVDGGVGTLRLAITTANANAGPDTITFSAPLSGATISPATALPDVTDETIIDGDLDDDGRPDIFIDGSGLATGRGLTIRQDNCVLEGLAIGNFPTGAVSLGGVNNCEVYSCHLGANLAGTAAATAGTTDLSITSGGGHIIGGKNRANVFAGGTETGSLLTGTGLSLNDTQDNVIAYNHFGIRRGGNAVLGAGSTGITMSNSTNSRLHHNLFGGTYYGIRMSGCSRNAVYHNTFGLGANGTTVLPITSCIGLRNGSTSNRIGGTSAAAGNVFAGDALYALSVDDATTTGNRIQGNWFGTNAAGTASRALRTAIEFDSAGAHTVGGTSAGARNYFCQTSHAVKTYQCSGKISVIGNTFGNLPNGRAGPRGYSDVRVDRSSVLVRDNKLNFVKFGVLVYEGTTAHVVDVFGNVFRNCEAGIDIEAPARVRMGNLSNTSSGDDGGNIFRLSNYRHIRNMTATSFRAEGNKWNTTVRSEIEAKITDRGDDPALGRIDFDPLFGGVHPTGVSEASVAAITSASATPTPAGAEIAYALSSPATVTITVRNLAGRPVSTVLREQAAAAGLQRVVWSGCADNGLRVPAGAYVVEVAVRSGEGAQTRALTTLRLEAR